MKILLSNEDQGWERINYARDNEGKKGGVIRKEFAEINEE